MATAPTQEQIADAVRRVLGEIAAAARKARRDPSAVTLVAVAKTKPAWMVDAAAAGGARVVGESYVQEALAKQPEVKAAVEWHLVGSLQTNKAKMVVGKFALLHALDSEKLARELDKRAAAAGVERVDTLVEVNLAGEETKAGIAPEDAEKTIEAIRPLGHLRVRGLMAMPPPDDPETNRPRFAALRELAAKLRDRGVLPADATVLSMGTTHDFAAAVEEGATLVRVGTAIFGEREYRK